MMLDRKYRWITPKVYPHNCASLIKAYLIYNDGDLSELMEILSVTDLNRRQIDILKNVGIPIDQNWYDLGLPVQQDVDLG